MKLRLEELWFISFVKAVVEEGETSTFSPSCEKRGLVKSFTVAIFVLNDANPPRRIREVLLDTFWFSPGNAKAILEVASTIAKVKIVIDM